MSSKRIPNRHKARVTNDRDDNRFSHTKSVWFAISTLHIIISRFVRKSFIYSIPKSIINVSTRCVFIAITTTNPSVITCFTIAKKTGMFF